MDSYKMGMILGLPRPGTQMSKNQPFRLYYLTFIPSNKYPAILHSVQQKEMESARLEAKVNEWLNTSPLGKLLTRLNLDTLYLELVECLYVGF